MTVRAAVHVSADQHTVCDTEQGFKVPNSDVQVEFLCKVFQGQACFYTHAYIVVWQYRTTPTCLHSAVMTIACPELLRRYLLIGC